MFKVQPLFNLIRQKVLQLPLEEFLCIDEQIVPFKGKLAAKQYRDIYAGGTVRVIRIYSAPLISDKEIMKKEREFSSNVTCKAGSVLTSWLDNRTVVMESNFVSIGEEDTVDRWDKKKKEYMNIICPETLVRCKARIGVKRGRPSNEVIEARIGITFQTERRPLREVRLDGVDHLSVVDKRKNGCYCLM
ncbi:hypothetical protein J437_LFUL010942 [Ladona fulva]|uniref:Transposase n=1 Tax=Ladona fulva TaxID=123851 RepID=A0A8K0P0C7_LADFU|nr:hypothetical protein J437_LFUL010942 [Ladona fulva]